MTPCVEWQGYRDAKGYGKRTFGKSLTGTQLVHRQMWILARGSISSSTVVMHTCDNPACIRLDHLRLGTQADNLADMRAKGRWHNQNTHKTHCPRGHPYDEGNTYMHRGKRSCKACTRIRQAARRR